VVTEVEAFVSILGHGRSEFSICCLYATLLCAECRFSEDCSHETKPPPILYGLHGFDILLVDTDNSQFATRSCWHGEDRWRGDLVGRAELITNWVKVISEADGISISLGFCASNRGGRKLNVLNVQPDQRPSEPIHSALGRETRTERTFYRSSAWCEPVEKVSEPL